MPSAATRSTITRNQKRSMPRRNDIQDFIAIGLAISILLFPLVSRSQAIVDCVYPGHVLVSRAQGKVVDPTGVAIPGAAVAFADDHGVTLQTKTDNRGMFRLAARPGMYSFKASFPMFEPAHADLEVGRNLVRLVRPSDLHVILGLGGSDCAWVTTSQRKFKQIIESNKKRSEVAVQKDATKK